VWGAGNIREKAKEGKLFMKYIETSENEDLKEALKLMQGSFYSSLNKI